MNLSDRVISNLVENKKIRDSGGYVSIPFLNYPKFSTVIPGIQKKKYSITTANTKVGKTQITDALFLHEPLYFLETVPNSGIDVEIFYFSLEVSAENKFLSLVSKKLYQKFKIVKSPENLKSQFNSYILEDYIVEYLKSDEFKQWSDFVLSKVTFIDNIRNPTGIYKYMREHLCKNGKLFTDDNREVSLQEVLEQKVIYNYYKANNPNKYTIVLVDHYSLFTPENGGTLWDAIFTFSSRYALHLRDTFECHVVGIQQQASDQEKMSFTFKGDLLVDKLRPSADGLGDCKLTSRDTDYMFGLFSPMRYQIKEYEGYNIEVLQDNYRELSILLNRSGGSKINLDLYFNGSINWFSELPKPDSPEMKKIYSNIINKK